MVTPQQAGRKPGRPQRKCVMPGRCRAGRLVANRVTAGDLDVHVTGDPGQATAVLAAAATLALD